MSESEFPSISEQAKNLTNLVQSTILDAIKGNKVFVSDEEKENRMAICKVCEYYHEEHVRCLKCGCFLEHKSSYSASTCPINKWIIS